MYRTTLVVLSCCAALAVGEGPSAAYGPPAYASAATYSAPAPVPAFAPSPAFAAAPALRAYPSLLRVTPGVYQIPVVPFPGRAAVGHRLIDHVAGKVNAHVNAVNEVANLVASKVVRTVQTVGNIAAAIATEKANFLDSQFGGPAPAVPSTIVFTPDTLAMVQPPAGLAPPVPEYGAPRF